MPQSPCRSVLALAFLAATVAAPALAAEKKPVMITNDAAKLAECAVVIDGRIRNYLKLKPGKSYSDVFDERRMLQLVCERTEKEAVWRLRPGTDYRLVLAPSGRLDITPPVPWQ